MTMLHLSFIHKCFYRLRLNSLHLERLDTLQTVNSDFQYAIKWTKKVIEEYDPVDNFTEFYENNIMDVIGDEVIDPHVVYMMKILFRTSREFWRTSRMGT